MTYPAPVYVGQFDAIKAADTVDLYIDIAADLVAGEAIQTVTFTLITDIGGTVPGAVTAHTETATRTDFRLTAPSVGAYQLMAVFKIDDGQTLTRFADVLVV